MMVRMFQILVVFALLSILNALALLRHPHHAAWKRSYALFNSCPNAAKCSGAYREKGCDGNGKIQGGIATIPLLKWWPIKVYRPCPAYLQAGYVYRREGQTLEQVLFSEPSFKTKQAIEQRKLDELLGESKSDSTESQTEDQLAKRIADEFPRKPEE